MIVEWIAQALIYSFAIAILGLSLLATRRWWGRSATWGHRVLSGSLVLAAVLALLQGSIAGRLIEPLPRSGSPQSAVVADADSTPSPAPEAAPTSDRDSSPPEPPRLANTETEEGASQSIAALSTGLRTALDSLPRWLLILSMMIYGSVLIRHWISIARSLRATQSLLRRASPVVDPAVDAILRVHTPAAAKPRLLTHDSVRTPGCWRGIRSFILLPPLTPRGPGLEVALLHELTHLRRWDPWRLVAWQVFRSLLWFHPIACWMRREAEFYVEAACDEQVARQLGSRQCAEALVDHAAGVGPTPGPVLLVSWIGQLSSLPRRIEMLCRDHSPLTKRTGLGLVALATTTLLAITLAEIGLASPGLSPQEDTAVSASRDDAKKQKTPSLGLSLRKPRPELAAQLDLDVDEFLVVQKVSRNSIASTAGVLRYDVIESVDGGPVPKTGAIKRLWRENGFLELGVRRAGRHLIIHLGVEAPNKVDPKRGSKIKPPRRRTVTIQTGDSLHSIAKRMLGSGNRWREILKANPGLDTDRLRVGQVLQLPPEPTPKIRRH